MFAGLTSQFIGLLSAVTVMWRAWRQAGGRMSNPAADEAEAARHFALHPPSVRPSVAGNERPIDE